MLDKVFGELNYKNGWERVCQLDFWNKKEIKIVISAYETEEPNAEQRDSFCRLIDDTERIARMSYKKMYDYLSAISEDIVLYCGMKEFPEDIFEIISLNHFLFMESGNFAIMCDAKWDDHGVVVLCTETEMIAGPQDIVWMYE